MDEKKKKKGSEKRKEKCQSIECSTYATSTLLKRDKGRYSLGRGGHEGRGAAEGIVTVISPCVWKCACAHVRAGRSVGVWRSTVQINLQ